MVHTRRITANRLLVRLEHGQKGGTNMKRLLDWTIWCEHAAYLADSTLNDFARALDTLTNDEIAHLQNEARRGKRGPGTLPRKLLQQLHKRKQP